MNIKVKQLTLLATAGFLLAACGQGKKEESTQATTQAQNNVSDNTSASNYHCSNTINKSSAIRC